MAWLRQLEQLRPVHLITLRTSWGMLSGESSSGSWASILNYKSHVPALIILKPLARVRDQRVNALASNGWLAIRHQRSKKDKIHEDTKANATIDSLSKTAVKS